MNIEQALKSIGLNEKESAVYLACLELGQDTVSHVAKKAGLKRPTVYLVLDSLQQKGLTNTVTRGKRTIYGAEEPRKLFGLVAKQDRALKTILPYLEAINNKRQVKPRIRFYEGREGLMRIYEEIFSSKEMYFWGSMESILKDFGDAIETFINISNTKKPKTYDLLTDTPEDRRFAKRVIRPGYEIRFFPKELKVFIDSTLFDNKLSVIAFDPEPHGLIIESEAIIKSFRSLWELAWRGATPYKPTKKII